MIGIFYLKFVFVFLAFVDDLNEYSFSFGMYLPPMVNSKLDILSFNYLLFRMSQLQVAMICQLSVV